MKNLNKILSILFIFIFIFTISTVSFAAIINSEKANLEIVENNICTININKFSEFEKKLLNYDLEKKELTLGLKVSNNAETILNTPSEVFLVIDNSLSMEEEVSSGETRIKAVTDAAKSLATDLLKYDTVKLGIIRFSTGDNEGTISDATLITKPTNSKDTVLNSISSIVNSNLGIRTNIDAGITLAYQNFSDNIDNKFIVLLTDGVPNTTIGGPTLTYSGETTTRTLSKLKQIENSGINIFTVMTGVPNINEPTSGKTYKALAEEIFGTTTNTTSGKFYYIPDEQINKTITESVLNNFIDTSKNDLTNLKIYDYFPQEIIDNFDFDYVTNPNIGNVSTQIDLDNKCIIWTIDKLEPGETANLSYKLKLKQNIDSNILDKILNTNTKVDITAKEIPETKTSDISPKIRVAEKPNVAPTPIPQAGQDNFVFCFIIIFVICSVYFIYKIKKED